MTHELIHLMLILAPGLPVVFMLPGLNHLGWLRIFALLPAALIVAIPQSLELDFPILITKTRFAIDAHGKWLLGFFILIWSSILITLEKRLAKSDWVFDSLLMLAMAATLALAVVRDILGFYFFYSLLGYVLYGLLVLLRKNDQDNISAARVFILFQVIGDLFLFELSLSVVSLGGSTSFTSLYAVFEDVDKGGTLLIFLLLGLIIKAGIWPFHVWAPMMFQNVPIVQVVLMGIIMPSVGLFGMVSAFHPIPEISPEWGHWLKILALVAIFYSMLVGITQKHPNSVLAYAGVLFTGQFLVLLGDVLISPEGWISETWLLNSVIAYHGLVMTALVLSSRVAASIDPPAHKVRVWLLPALLWIAGSVQMMIMASHDKDRVLSGLAQTSILAMTFLIVRFAYLLQKGRIHAKPQAWLYRMPLGVILLVAASTWYYWFGYLPRADSLLMHLPISLALMLLGLVLAAVIWWRSEQGVLINRPVIPPGDYLMLIESRGQIFLRVTMTLANSWLPLCRDLSMKPVKSLLQLQMWPASLQASGRYFQPWRTAVLLMVLLGVCLVISIQFGMY